MSQENHNQEKELSNLQEQYQSLQEKLGQQEIVNDNRIHEMIQASTTGFKRRNAEIILTYGLLAATACWVWYSLDLRLPFLIISLLLFALIGFFEWYSCRRILKINIEDSDVQTLVQKMEKTRTHFSLLWITGVFALCLWMMLIISGIGEKLDVTDLRSSFAMIAAILVLSIILIICNISRLAALSDELVAKTTRLEKTVTPPSYRRSVAYWIGIAMLTLSLIGLVFKLMHWPFGFLLFMSVGLVGPVYVILTAVYLLRLHPKKHIVIVIAAIVGLFLVIDMVFKLMHWPFGGIQVLIVLPFILIAILVSNITLKKHLFHHP